jgi:hypothetical protein
MTGRRANRPEWPDATAAALATHLRAHVGQFFGMSGDLAPEVRLLRAELRARSSLYEFHVPLPTGDQTLLVKLATTPAAAKTSSASNPSKDRPRIAPFAEQRAAVDLEYRALSRIRDHFVRLNDPRFGAVRVFDRLALHDGFIMEAVDQPTLRTLALRGRHSRPLPAVLHRSFRHSGAWLQAYHGLAVHDDAGRLQTRRDDFIRFIEDLAEYLASHTGHGAFFAWLTSTMSELARTHLPALLPLALGHGDYAMRNILVGADERVTVLDTLALYRTCMYRDLGYFLGDLRCSVLPALARGQLRHGWRLVDHREAFLRGYFGGSQIPQESIRLYEVQAMLERWASIVSEWHAAAGHVGRLRRASLPLVSAFLRPMIRSTVCADAYGRATECLP